jgi:aspartate/methionine/tyrosine aminotransferase
MVRRFSSRTAWDLHEDALAKVVRERRAAGGELLDLTVSNPTVCGFRSDEAAILGALANPAAMVYEPDPRGLPVAREAVASYYAEHGCVVDPDAVVLTTSTSEAYSFLFRLLCDFGDSVLVAQPSYPLFDFVAGLDHVRLESYPLFYDFGWWIDFAELERRIGPRTRAVLLVHPNNPTGHTTAPAERARLQELCARHGLALVVDEVFLDYGLTEDPLESFAGGEHPCLTFVVSGLSKIAALPQMKVGWLAVFGPDAQPVEALNRLEIIADTYLSMNAPAQHALPVWLAGRAAIASQIRDRVKTNLATLAAEGIEFLPVAAGWSAVIRLPPLRNDELDPAFRLVEELGVVTHPGGFYGLPGRRDLVISLIGDSQTLAKGVAKLTQWSESNGLTAQGEA